MSTHETNILIEARDILAISDGNSKVDGDAVPIAREIHTLTAPSQLDKIQTMRHYQGDYSACRKALKKVMLAHDWTDGDIIGILTEHNTSSRRATI